MPKISAYPIVSAPFPRRKQVPYTDDSCLRATVEVFLNFCRPTWCEYQRPNDATGSHFNPRTSLNIGPMGVSGCNRGSAGCRSWRVATDLSDACATTMGHMCNEVSTTETPRYHIGEIRPVRRIRLSILDVSRFGDKATLLPGRIRGVDFRFVSSYALISFPIVNFSGRNVGPGHRKVALRRKQSWSYGIWLV